MKTRLAPYASVAFFAATAFFARTSPAAIGPQPIARVPLKHFYSDGAFEGGSRETGTLNGVRFTEEGNLERWTFDFGETTPHLLLRYVKGDTVFSSDGTALHEKPSRIVIQLEKIQRNRILRDKLLDAVKHSQLVREVTIYPPVEHGDLAIEMVLKRNVVFEPYQPLDSTGGRRARLVLDMKR